jgi:hypothetical protein
MNVKSFSIAMLDYLKEKNDSKNRFKKGNKVYIEAECSGITSGDSMHKLDCRVFNVDEYPQSISVAPEKLTVHESVIRDDLFTFSEWVEFLSDVVDYMEIQDFKSKSGGNNNEI